VHHAQLVDHVVGRLLGCLVDGHVVLRGLAVLGVGGLAVLFGRQRSATGSTGQVGDGGTRAGKTAV
jgi:hypothetical protein